MKQLLVLYSSEKNSQGYWAVYSGGAAEANSEFELMSKDDPELIECGRIWINTVAELDWFSLPS